MAADERDLLASERRKKERALDRLKSLYLYNDEAISERDYLVEKKSLADSIDKIDKRLEEIERNSSHHFTLTDEEFMAKASVFHRDESTPSESASSRRRKIAAPNGRWHC